MTDEQAKNYEQSYKRMWDEVALSRRKRDEALQMVDAARNLIIALEHDMQSGQTKVSLITHIAFNKLRSRLEDL